MAIAARWRPLDALPPKRGRDAMPGVYELAGEDKRVIYIGQSARDVPNRIRQHLVRTNCISERAHYWRYAYSRVPQADEAKHIAGYMHKYGDLPPCNKATPKTRDAKKRYLERSRES
jgi:hypothetical protein